MKYTRYEIIIERRDGNRGWIATSGNDHALGSVPHFAVYNLLDHINRKEISEDINNQKQGAARWHLS